MAEAPEIRSLKGKLNVLSTVMRLGNEAFRRHGLGGLGLHIVNNSRLLVRFDRSALIDMRSGRIAYAVLSFGGFLGMGDKLFAIPWGALAVDTSEEQFILDIDRKVLEGAPGFDKAHWPNMADRAWGEELCTYYGAKPYWT